MVILRHGSGFLTIGAIEAGGAVGVLVVAGLEEEAEPEAAVVEAPPFVAVEPAVV